MIRIQTWLPVYVILKAGEHSHHQCTNRPKTAKKWERPDIKISEITSETPQFELYLFCNGNITSGMWENMEVNGWNENVSTLQSNQDHSDVKTTETQTVAGIIWLMCRVEGEFGRLLRRQFRRWWRFVLFCNSDPSKQLVTKTQRKGSCPLIDSVIKREIIVCVWLLQDRWRGDMVLVVWSYSLWIFYFIYCRDQKFIIFCGFSLARFLFSI